MSADVSGSHPFLDVYLSAFQQWLDDPEVSESMVNRPGEILIERLGRIEFHNDSKIGDQLLQRLAEQVARVSNQGVSRERPLLAATLPNGHRVQFVAPSATRAHWALAIRRHRLVDLPLEAYDRGPLERGTRDDMPDLVEHPIRFLKEAVRRRQTILISGGTST